MIDTPVTEQAKRDAAEAERRAAFERNEASQLPRASHEVIEAARVEAEKRKAHPLPGEEGYVLVKDPAKDARDAKAAKDAQDAKVAKAALTAKDAREAQVTVDAQAAKRRAAETAAVYPKRTV